MLRILALVLLLCLCDGAAFAKVTASSIQGKLRAADRDMRKLSFVRAETTLVTALGQTDKIEQNDAVVADTLERLASVCDARGKYSEGENYASRALTLREKVSGPNHGDVVHSLDILATIYCHKGKSQQSLGTFQRALDIAQNSFGNESDKVATILTHMGAAFLEAEQPGQAEQVLRWALKIRSAAGAHSPEVAESLSALGKSCIAQERPAEAEALCAAAVAIAQERRGVSELALTSYLQNLAEAYAAEKLYRRADALYKRCLTSRVRLLGLSHPATRETETMYASLLKAVYGDGAADAMLSRTRRG